MTLETLLAWWNLIFVAPFGLAVAYLLVYAFSGLTFGDADADGSTDADVDHDLPADPDHDLGVDHELEADHDLAADHDLDADHDLESDGSQSSNAISPSTVLSPLNAALDWLGVGRVPLSILLMVLLLAWGSAGFLTNQLTRGLPALSDWRSATLSIPLAALTAILITRLVVRSIDRWLPLNESSARRRHDLLGLTGKSIYEINDRFGMVSVRDDQGDLFQVPCRVAPGHDPIAKNDAATLVAYNMKDKLFQVIPAAAKGEAVGQTTARSTGPSS